MLTVSYRRLLPTLTLLLINQEWFYFFFFSFCVMHQSHYCTGCHATDNNSSSIFWHVWAAKIYYVRTVGARKWANFLPTNDSIINGNKKRLKKKCKVWKTEIQNDLCKKSLCKTSNISHNYSHGKIILRLFHALPNLILTTSETKRDYY